MEDQELKLKLSALLLVEGVDHDSSYYQKKLEELFGVSYSKDKVEQAFKEILIVKDEIQLNRFIVEAEDDLQVYPEQHFEGN